MELEPALIQELLEITELSPKIYPLVAPSGTKAPYLTFESSFGRQVNTLGGYKNRKVVDVEFRLIALNYEQLKHLQTAVISKLVSMQLRVIGTDGPYVHELTYESPVELYEPLPKLHRTDIEIKIYI